MTSSISSIDRAATPDAPQQHHPTPPPSVHQAGSGPTLAAGGSRIPERDSIRTRLQCLFNTKKVPHAPAARFGPDWQTAVPAICDCWLAEQQAFSVDKVSRLSLSRMKALEYERKRAGDIPAGERLLRETKAKRDYYAAEVEAFLRAVGLDTEAATAVQDSFKLAGTGGLHRQHATVGATVSNAVGAAQALTPDPMAKAVLSGVRMAMQLGVAWEVLASGERRFRNAGTEDMLPLGRAAAAPAATIAPNVAQASSAVISNFQRVKGRLKKLEDAITTLEEALQKIPPDENEIGNAKSEVELALAKVCHLMAVKAAYKASSESAKIELRGNVRYLMTSFTGTGTTLFAALLSIMTPALIAAPVTGGISAGAAATAIALYLGYQLSTGPSRDGEDKANRAIVALAKLLEVLSGEDSSTMISRAQAYTAYLQERKTARLSFGTERAQRKARAKANLLERLEQITHDDTPENRLTPEQNWETYRRHRHAELYAGQKPGDMLKDESQDQAKTLEQEFRETSSMEFDAEKVADAWKTPMRIRMEAARRLLKGKVAQAHECLIDAQRQSSSKARQPQASEQPTNSLRKSLLDLFNLELALRNMQSDSGAESVTAAQACFAAIEDEDVRKLFCGDGRQQVEAVTLAKTLTAGEAARYILPNAGSVAVSVAVNIGVPAADMAVNTEKALGSYDGPVYSDYRFLALSQAGAQPSAHISSGDRAAFQRREMQPALHTVSGPDAEDMLLELEGDLALVLHDTGRTAEGLDRLIATLVRQAAVPSSISLSLAPGADDAESSSAATRAAGIKLNVTLKETASYHRVRYENAPFNEQAAMRMKLLKVVARQIAMSVTGLPLQAAAQLPLSATRESFSRLDALERKARRLLKQVPASPADADEREQVQATEQSRPDTLL